MLISRDEPQITAFFEGLFFDNKTKENYAEKFPIDNGCFKMNGHFKPKTDFPIIDEMPVEILRSIYIKVYF